MKRSAILVDRNCSPSQVANVAAILMGDLAVSLGGLYDTEDLFDKGGVPHARIKNSVVVLKANSPIQIRNFIGAVREMSDLSYSVFTHEGQKINNGYDQYCVEIGQSTIDDLTPLGAIVYGDETAVKAATKKYSSY